MSIGKDNFSGGVTQLVRVPAEAPASMARISGYDPASGALEPEGVVEDITVGAPLPGGLPEQTPFAFASGGTVFVVARDAEGKLRRFAGEGGTWGGAGAALAVPEEAEPVRVGTQVVFPTTSGLMAYEPEVTEGNNTRLLSLKGPLDYAEAEKPTATLVAHPQVQMWDIDNWHLASMNPATNAVECNPVDVSVGAQIYFAAAVGGVTPGSGHPYYVTEVLTEGFRFSETLGGPTFDIVIPEGGETYNHFNSFGDQIWEVVPNTLGVSMYVSNDSERVTLSYPACHSSQSCVFYDGGGAGWALLGKRYLLMDLSADWELGNEQAGQFVNDAEQLASGLQFSLYRERYIEANWDDSLVRSYAIPKLTPQKTNRVVIHLGTLPTQQSCTMAAADDTVTCASHGYSVGQAICFGGATGGVEVGTVYFVTATPTSDTFQFSATSGGPTFDITADGANTVSCTIKTISIDTASYFSWPAESGGGEGVKRYILTLNSQPFSEDWRFSGNALLSAANPATGDWYAALPPDPGGTGTSAAILEDFTWRNDVAYSPAQQGMRYCYCFSGLSSRASARPARMVSNPSLPSGPDVAIDPWRPCTVTITPPTDSDGHSVVTDYADYVDHALLYRQVVDTPTQVAGEWTYVAAIPIASSMTYTDVGEDEDPTIDGLAVPEVLELSNDFASPARYVTYSSRRVWAAGLDYRDGAWQRPTAIEVSSFEKTWAFPTTVDEETGAPSDGVELDNYAQTGSEVRGLISHNENVFVFLDNEFFVVRGEGPLKDGYLFTRLDSVGCRSSRTVVDCRGVIIWHSGAHFYAYTGGAAEPISRHKLDSSQIDWEQPHNALFWQEKYVLFCTYGGVQTVIVYDLSTGAWRWRPSSAYGLVGICTSGDGDTVYGVTETGGVVSLFSGGSDYGASSTVREVHTQYWPVSAPGQDVQVAFVALEALSDSANGESLEVTVHTQGRVCTEVTRSLSVTRDRTYYEVPVNVAADAVKLELSYTGTNPPAIYFLGVSPDPIPTAGMSGQ